MAHPITPIPVEHHAVIHRIEPSRDSAPRALTLLELIDAIGEVTDDEREVVATVSWMLESGRIQLVGNFRGATVDALLD